MSPVDPKLSKRALSRVRRVRQMAADQGLTEWEDEFLTSVEDRIATFGRAFADPDKGAMSAPLSLRQGLKLKEISGKKKPAAALENVHDTPKPRKRRTPLTRKAGLSSKGFKARGLNGRVGMADSDTDDADG